MIPTPSVRTLLLLLPIAALPFRVIAAPPVVRDIALAEQDLTVYSRTFLDQFTMRTALVMGDLDGDGSGDLVIGGYASSDGGTVSVLFGPLPVGTIADFAMAPPDVTIYPPLRARDFGHSLAVADLSGDGIDDLVIGAPGSDGASARPRAGAAYVVFGPLVAGTDLVLSAFPPAVTVLGADGGVPPLPGDQLGFAVAAADLSGDGVADIAVSSPLADGPGNTRGDAGEVHVLFGPFAAGTVIDLASVPASATVLGAPSVAGPGGLAGFALAIADVSGGGGADLLVGAESADDVSGTKPQAGRAFAFFGPLAAGTVLDLATAPADVTIFGADADDRLGTSIAAGDMSGDGLDDLVAGAPQAAGPGNVRPFCGEVHAFFGPLPAGAAFDLATAPASLTVHGADGLSPGDGSGDLLGQAVACADVNGDGVEDLVAGAPESDGPSPGTRVRCGSARVVAGPFAPGSVHDLASTAADVTIHGASQQHRAGSSVATGDWNGDGRDDVLLGAPQIFERIPSGGGAYGVVVAPAPFVNRPPVCNAGGPYVLECAVTPRCAIGLEVQLDGTRTVDPNPGERLTFVWSITCGSFAFFATGPTPTVCVSPRCGRPCFAGLTVTDQAGNTSTCEYVEIRIADETPPTLSGVPADATVECDAVPPPAMPAATEDCPAAAVRVEFVETRADGTCPHAYTLTREWTAESSCGQASAATQVLSVVDTTAPVLLGVPEDVTVDCASVPLPANPSASDNCDAAPGLAFAQARIDGPCAGTYTLERTWTATDACGNASSRTQVVSVRDTTPPVVQSGDEDLHCLWPPNHRLVGFTASQFSPVVADDCSEPVTWRFTSCASDQDEDSRGDGHAAPDCVVANDGQSFQVRAERSGIVAPGRRYSVSIVATDACGNASEPVVIGNVRVPHDSRAGARCPRTGR